MNRETNEKEKDYSKNTGHPALNDKQQQSDPNLTELKGFTDSDVPLEPTADKTESKEKERKEES